MALGNAFADLLIFENTDIYLILYHSFFQAFLCSLKKKSFQAMLHRRIKCVTQNVFLFFEMLQRPQNKAGI